MDRDTLHRFLIENTDVRGVWVHLDSAWQKVLECREYPAPLREILGQAAAAVCLMSATIKFEGSLILQISGTGPVTLLVMQATSDGRIRGMAQWTGEPASEKLVDVFGEGRIVISILTEEDSDRYQGIVRLEGEDLAHCLQNYFEQSEQIPTRIHLAADHEMASGLLIQSLPSPDQQARYDTIDDDSWNHAVCLTDTIKKEELLKLDVETLLHRLFHDEDVRLSEPKRIHYECTCSQDRIEDMIRSLGKEEALSILEDEELIKINCDFCNTKYTLDAIDVERVFDRQISEGNQSLH